MLELLKSDKTGEGHEGFYLNVATLQKPILTYQGYTEGNFKEELKAGKENKGGGGGFEEEM